MDDRCEATVWIACGGARVAVDANDDGSYTPRSVIVVLHSAGMLVERRIPAPDHVRDRTFADPEAAARAILSALELRPRIREVFRSDTSEKRPPSRGAND